jgi:hypothetical protein
MFRVIWMAELAICPACDRVLETEEAQETVDNHNTSRHDGDAVAQSIEGTTVEPDTVNELVDTAREFTREQQERFVRTVMRDDRFRTSEGGDDES